MIVDRVLSTSFIAALPAAERERVAARVRVLIAETPALRGRDHVAFPYQLAVYAAPQAGLRCRQDFAPLGRPL